MYIRCLSQTKILPASRRSVPSFSRFAVKCRAHLDCVKTNKVPKLARRELVQLVVALSAQLVANPAQAKQAGFDWSSPGLAAPENLDEPKFFKTDSGVRVQQLSSGTGPAARAGDTVTIEYVLRRSNGYFIYSTVEGVSFQPMDVPTGPFIFKIGDSKTIAGLQEAVTGMQAGGKRRVLVPPQLGYVATALEPQPPTFATQRQLLNHSSEPLLFEIQMVKVKG